jgi:parallel beta-helix repeat protein
MVLLLIWALLSIGHDLLVNYLNKFTNYSYMGEFLKKTIFLIMFAISVIMLQSSFSLAANHALYPSFSTSENGFKFNNVSNTVSINDTIIYRMGYYSINGSAWVQFNFSGVYYNNDSNWIQNSAVKSLPSFGYGEHYIIAYSCTYNYSAWDCHEGKWQLMIIIRNETKEANTSVSVKYLVENGVSKADIIVASNAPNMVKLAAKYLQTHVYNMSGALLPIRNTIDSNTNYHIYVGRSSYTDALGITNEDCEHGSFKIISAQNYLVLLGNDDVQNITGPYSLRWSSDMERANIQWVNITGSYTMTPYYYHYRKYNPTNDIWAIDGRGTMNAVYEFSYDQGMRWYYPGDIGTVIPSKRDIIVADMNKHVKPDFSVRMFAQYYKHFMYSSEDELKWQFSLRENFGVDVIGISYGHGTDKVISRKEMKSLHPEYYAIWDGVRMNESDVKPDLCSEGLLAQNVKYVRDIFNIYGDRMTSVMPSDGFNRASESSTACKAQETPQRGTRGSLSDYVWGYVNRVALEVYKTHPEKMISGGAYTAYALPPENIAQMAPNVAIILCRWRGWFEEDPSERAFWGNLTTAWLAKLPSKEIFIWDYYIYNRPGGTYESIPVIFPHLISEDLKWLKGKSSGEQIEVLRNDNSDNNSYDVFAANALNVYITARLYWDANQDVDALLNEYYTLYYGPASQKMKQFVEYAEENYPEADDNPAILVNLRKMAIDARSITGNTIYGKRIDLLIDLMNSKYVGTDATISSCRILNSPTTKYKLNADVASSETCFTIEDDGITLDCQGHTITYDTTGSGKSGIFINGQNYFNLSNCIIKNGNLASGNGVYVANSRGTEIKNNNINVAAASGIYLTNSVNITIQNNYASSSSNSGIFVNANSSRIIGNTGKSISNRGMYIFNTHHSTISGNNASSESSRGAVLANTTYNSFTDNLFSSSADEGVWTYQCKNNNFVRNSAISNNKSGLYLYGSSTNNQFTEQTAIGGTYGIQIGGGSSGNTFQNCGIIKGNTKNVSINSDSTNNVFTNCIY